MQVQGCSHHVNAWLWAQLAPASAAYEDGGVRPGDRQWQVTVFGQLVVPAGVACRFARPHLFDDLQGFLEPLEPFGEWRERHPQSAVLALVPGCAEAQIGSP